MINIRQLFAKHKAEWCREFFPEYAEIFGGYPPAIKVSYGMVSGTTGAPELTPWSDWGLSGPGRILAEGVRLVQIPAEPGKQAPRIPFRYEEVPEAEYRAWCDGCNFFRNGAKTPLGGPGLHPEVFIGAFDRRYGAYWARRRRYEKEGLPVKPDYITCPTGLYLPMRGPTRANPWGVNSAFVLNGYGVPSYVSDRYGPAHFTPPHGVPLPTDAQGNVLIPGQGEYDRARWSCYLS